jgi:hypothetical protein
MTRERGHSFLFEPASPRLVARRRAGLVYDERTAGPGFLRLATEGVVMTAKILRSVCALSLASIALAACNDSGSVDGGDVKGRIDRGALVSGVTVAISGQTGQVAVPMEVAIPEDQVGGGSGGDDDLENELSGAVSLMVANNATGTIVDLASGTIVPGSPVAPGQWSWELNGARDNATMTFYNQTTVGQVLFSSNTYTAQLSVSSNGYVESESAFTFPITVTGN